MSPSITNSNVAFENECLTISWTPMQFINFQVKVAQQTSNFTKASFNMLSETHSIERRQAGVIAAGGIAALTAYASHAIESWLNKGRMVKILFSNLI